MTDVDEEITLSFQWGIDPRSVVAIITSGGRFSFQTREGLVEYYSGKLMTGLKKLY